MAARTSTERVRILEQKVEALETLPARVTAVELQIVQLREEMRGEFSAIRQELHGLHAADAALRSEMSALREDLRGEIRAGDEETRRYMRVLHEEVLARIATLQEGRRRM